MKWKSMKMVEGKSPPDREGEVWENYLYICFKYQGPDHQAIMMGGVEGFPEMIWLSIKRRDQQPIHDWRALQNIKNEVVGVEHEGFEIYPNEERLWDSANQFHLWVFADKGIGLPVGVMQRFTKTPNQAKAVGAKQRRTNEYK